MLLLTCASLQRQATPSWLPGSLHEPRSQATSSDMRNLAHQPRRFCLALGLAPPRLLLLVPVSVLFGRSSPETLKYEVRGGRPNYKMCWWSAERKTKFCSFNDRQQFYKHTCPTNTIHWSDQPPNLNNPQMFVSTATTTVIHSRKKAHDTGTPSVTRSEDSLCFVSVVSMIPDVTWSDFKLALSGRRLDSLYCPENLRSKMHIPVLQPYRPLILP